MSGYSRYRGRTIGRLLNFIHSYAPSRVAEQVQFKGDNVLLHGQLWATVEWEGDTDYPIFVFKGEDAANLTNTQQALRSRVIEDDRILENQNGARRS